MLVKMLCVRVWSRCPIQFALNQKLIGWHVLCVGVVYVYLSVYSCVLCIYKRRSGNTNARLVASEIFLWP